MYNYRRLFFDYEKEERWLNNMSQQGLEFVDYSLFKYTFADSEPGKYKYRIELLDTSPHAPKSLEYMSFCQELGIHKVGTHGRWVFFKKLASQGDFDIYTDKVSISRHYRMIGSIYTFVGMLNVIAVFMNLGNLSYLNLALPLYLINVFLGLPLAYWGIRFLLKSRQALKEI